MCVCLYVQGKHNQQIFFTRDMISVSVSQKDTAILRYSSSDMRLKKYSENLAWYN